MRETTNDIEGVNRTLSPSSTHPMFKDGFILFALSLNEWRKHMSSTMWAYFSAINFALETLGKRDGAFLSQEWLAEHACVSQKRIAKGLKDLESVGAIERGPAVRDGETYPVWFIKILPPPGFVGDNF